jgi:hypothetical protein
MTMTSKKTRPSMPSRIGMWSTITGAIDGGWGPTARMLVILVVRGGIAIGTVLAVGASPAASVFRSLLP